MNTNGMTTIHFTRKAKVIKDLVGTLGVPVLVMAYLMWLQFGVLDSVKTALVNFTTVVSALKTSIDSQVKYTRHRDRKLDE